MYNFAYVCYNEFMRKSNSGFTIVEITVVVAIIGILISLVALNFTRVQAGARDTQRTTRASIVADALEKYYDLNGEYPSCSALSQSANVVSTTVLPGLDSTALMTPKSGVVTNSISCADLTAASTSPDVFAYVGDGSTDCTSGASCLNWTLKYTDESSGTVKTIKSRHTTLIATSGISTLTATPASFTKINLSWTAVTNAISYQVQQASDSNFTVGVVNSTIFGQASTQTGLTSGVMYWFRVKANSNTGQGGWSNTASATTVGAPVATLAFNSPVQLTANWGTTTGATSYTVQLSSDDFVTTTDYTVATLSKAYTGLTPNTTYKTRVKAIGPSDSSGWSTPVATPTTVPVPNSIPSISASNTGGNVLGTAGVTTCSFGTPIYKIKYNVYDGAWYAYVDGPSVTFGAYQGYKYSFIANAICRYNGSYDSALVGDSAAASTVYPFSQPPAPNYLAPAYYTHGVNQDPTYSGNCPAGGSWPVNGTFRDHFVGGASYGPHPWGYVGVPWVAAGYVEYWGQYQCATNYATSPMSPESYTYLRIY